MGVLHAIAAAVQSTAAILELLLAVARALVGLVS